MGMWTWGRVHTKFCQHLNPISTKGGGQIMPTLYWCPNQVLKAIGAPTVTTNFRLVAMKKPFGAAHALPLLASGFIYPMQDGGLV